MTPVELTKSLKTEAQSLGFELTGACPAVSPTGFDHFSQWLDAGYAGEMEYLETRREAYRHPRHVLDGVQSILMLGMVYRSGTAHLPQAGYGQVSRYAWGEGDYHDLIHRKLKQLVRFTRQLDMDLEVRGVVDTAPLLEREFAQLSGMGWQAKNTLLINTQKGSWFFLAALLLNAPLQYDQPHITSHCGTCTACLDACPTDAFVAPHQLDATRCISYLTIEHRSAIDRELRPAMGQWVFGCDVCQDVCPWNNKSESTPEPFFSPRNDSNPLELKELFFLSDDEFRQRFRKTPLWRPKRRGLIRNAAIALGNNPDDGHAAALSHGLNDREELIRGAVAWALGNHDGTWSAALLRRRRDLETEGGVLEEIDLALQRLGAT